MVEMIPDQIAPDIKSQAEARLFTKFRNYNTADHIAILHSLALSEHINNIFGEIDFVVACSRGILCIEVKGGEVSCDNGMWGFTNRYGVKTEKTEGPFQQVLGNMLSLRTHLKDRLGESDPLVRCQYACCVIMPDCCFEYDGPEITKEILFDRDTNTELGNIIETSFDYWTEQCRNKHGFTGQSLNDSQTDRLVRVLRGDFHFVPSMNDSIGLTVNELNELTEDQYRLLEGLSGNPRVLVSGAAGTGKTLLAVEQAKRKYDEGRKVLYLCYNRNIASFVQDRFRIEKCDITSKTIHSIMMSCCGIEFNTTMDDRYFSDTLPAMFLGLADDNLDKYDYLVVDEGQDLLSPRYIKCMDRLLKGGLENGNWLIFFDPNQNIYNRYSAVDDSIKELTSVSASFRLQTNCRNTKQISETNKVTTCFPNTGTGRVEGAQTCWIKYQDQKEEQKQFLKLLKDFRDEGIIGRDFVVLSKYAISNPKNLLHNIKIPSELGRLKTEKNIWKAKNNEIRFSTISSFKGLEANIVIFADADSFTEESARLLNYVAISRARARLYILYDAAGEDDRQKMIRRFVLGTDQ